MLRGWSPSHAGPTFQVSLILPVFCIHVTTALVPALLVSPLDTCGSHPTVLMAQRGPLLAHYLRCSQNDFCNTAKDHLMLPCHLKDEILAQSWLRICLQHMSVLSRSLNLYFLSVCGIQLPPHKTYAFSHVSPHSDDSYSAVNTRLKFPLLCENIPSLLQLWCSCLCGSLYLSLLETPLSFHCSDLLKVFVICSEIGVS